MIVITQKCVNTQNQASDTHEALTFSLIYKYIKKKNQNDRTIDRLMDTGFTIQTSHGWSYIATTNISPNFSILKLTFPQHLL